MSVTVEDHVWQRNARKLGIGRKSQWNLFYVGLLHIWILRIDTESFLEEKCDVKIKKH